MFSFFLLYDPLSLILLSICTFLRGHPRRLSDLSEATSLKKTDSPCPDNHQLSLGGGLCTPPHPCWNDDWPDEVIFKIFIFLPLHALKCAPVGAAAVSEWGLFPSSATVPSFPVYFLWTYTQHSVTQTTFAASTKLMEQEHWRDAAWLTPGRAGRTATGWSCDTQHGALYLCQ